MMFTGDGHGLHHSFVILRSWNKKFHKLECFRSAQVSLALIALMITLWSLKDSAREPQHWPSGDGVTRPTGGKKFLRFILTAAMSGEGEGTRLTRTD
jgi:hypothetical protein